MKRFFASTLLALPLLTNSLPAKANVTGIVSPTTAIARNTANAPVRVAFWQLVWIPPHVVPGFYGPHLVPGHWVRVWRW